MKTIKKHLIISIVLIYSGNQAIEIAEKMPTTNINRESLLARLYKGEKQLQQMRENMNSNFGKLIVDANHVIHHFYGGELKQDEYIRKTQCCY